MNLELHGGAIESWNFFRNKLDKLMTKHIPGWLFRVGQKKIAPWLSKKVGN